MSAIEKINGLTTQARAEHWDKTTTPGTFGNGVTRWDRRLYETDDGMPSGREVSQTILEKTSITTGVENEFLQITTRRATGTEGQVITAALLERSDGRYYGELSIQSVRKQSSGKFLEDKIAISTNHSLSEKDAQKLARLSGVDIEDIRNKTIDIIALILSMVKTPIGDPIKKITFMEPIAAPITKRRKSFFEPVIFIIPTIKLWVDKFGNIIDTPPEN